MTIKEMNLDDLKRQYLRRSGVTEAIRTLDAASFHRESAELMASVLRPHRSPHMDRESVRLRGGFDDLLCFYAAVEIACLIRFVPVPLPDNFRQSALSHLRHPDLRRYFERHHPRILPKQLRERLQGEREAYIEDSAEATALFMRFLELTRVLEEDQQTQVFRLVLTGSDLDCRPEDILDALENLERFRIER